MADFFISYNSADAAVAEEIAQALVDAGFTVRFAGWEVGLGTDISQWMTEALDDCDRLIAVCSKNYLKPGAIYSALERAAMLWQDIDGKRAAVIPVMVERCTLPVIIAARNYYDLTKGSVQDLAERLKNPPRGPGGPVQPVAPVQRTAGPFIKVPTGRPVIGRERELVDLRTALLAEGDVVLANGQAILAGQGGIGKTTLARAYAERHRDDYDGVLWVDATDRQAVIDGLMNPCGVLGVAVPDTPQEPHAQAVLSKLAETGQDWLIVYDNVEDRADIEGLTLHDAHLIATTRQGEGWDGFAVQTTEVLDFATEDGAAVRLLMAEAQRQDGAAEARALADDLGGLPLALVMAGGLIRKEGLGFAEYREQVGRIIAREVPNSDYPTSVIGAVRLSYDKLDADARLVADLFAWWAPEGLQVRLITDAPGRAQWEAVKDDVPDEVQSLAQSPDRVAAAVEALEARSLLRRDGGGFSLHRMTAAALLAAVYPGGASPMHSPNWDDCRRLTPHVRALWDSGQAPESLAMKYLLNQAGMFLGTVVADIQGAADMAEAKVALDEKLSPEDHRDIAVGHGNLGVALQRLGDLPGAVAALRRQIELFEKHDKESIELAISYEMLGGALLDVGRGGDRAALTEALKLHQHAGALWRRLVSRDSDQRAANLNKIAAIRDALGQPAAALRLFGYSLAIYRRVLPPGDARLGYGLLNVGAQELEAGAADRAEPLLEEALALWQAVYVEAPRHPEIVNAAGWLVSCYLVRALAGENAGLRSARAKRLCDEFGFDFEQRVERAKQYPYTPPDPEPDA